MRKGYMPKLSALLWLAAVLWCALLFYFSGQDGVESGELSWRFTRFVLRIFPFLPFDAATLNPILRDCAHFGIFAVEGALLGGALLTCLRSRTLSALISVTSCAALAGLNEYHQSFVEGRSAEFGDVLIDSAGGLTGTLLALLIFMLALHIATKRGKRD